MPDASELDYESAALITVSQLRRGDWFEDAEGRRHQVTEIISGGVKARRHGKISTVPGTDTVHRLIERDTK